MAIQSQKQDILNAIHELKRENRVISSRIKSMEQKNVFPECNPNTVEFKIKRKKYADNIELMWYLRDLQKIKSKQILRARHKINLYRTQTQKTDSEPLQVLFLDFDGVINCENLKEKLYCIPNDWDAYSLKLIDNIRYIIKRYNLKVVVSSTWRKNHTIPQMKKLLNELWELNTELLGYTTTINLDTDYKDRYLNDPNTDRRERGLQIQNFLDSGQYDIDKFIILDDDLDASFMHGDHFFKVDGWVGFNNKALKQFNKRMSLLGFKDYSLGAVK